MALRRGCLPQVLQELNLLRGRLFALSASSARRCQLREQRWEAARRELVQKGLPVDWQDRDLRSLRLVQQSGERAEAVLRRDCTDPLRFSTPLVPAVAA